MLVLTDRQRKRGIALKYGSHAVKRPKFGTACHVFLMDAGCCNACVSEARALQTPAYQTADMGIQFVNSPRNADVLLVLGGVANQLKNALLAAYEQVPEPKIVVAAGSVLSCAALHDDAQPVLDAGNVELLIPVTVRVEGCPPHPKEILRGIMSALQMRRDSHKEPF